MSYDFAETVDGVVPKPDPAGEAAEQHMEHAPLALQQVDPCHCHLSLCCCRHAQVVAQVYLLEGHPSFYNCSEQRLQEL